MNASEYWDSRPCNVRHSALPVGSPDYFAEVEKRKYFVEPHIPRFAQFERWSGKRVLEIGCGIGTDAVNFARAGASVLAIDASERSLYLARRRYLTGLSLQFSECVAELVDCCFVSLRQSFDLAYSFGVLHHVSDPNICLFAIRRMLKPDGELRIMVYNRYSWKRLRIALGLDQPEAAAGCPIWRTYSKQGITELLNRHGFRVVSISVEHIFPWKISAYKEYRYEKVWYFRWMPERLFRWLEHRIGWHLCVVARID